MKKTVSILTALLLAVSPAAQRAYAQEATVQVQQNVEESKASKVWNTVKGYAGKAANAVAENKGAIAGAVGATGAVALLGAGSFATYNGVTLRELIKTIWAAEGITMAQKVQLIAKVLFLKKEVTAAELANLKNQNIISASNANIKENESVINSADKKLNGIATEQEDLNKRKATQENNKKDAEKKLNEACEECKAAEQALGETNKCGKACYGDAGSQDTGNVVEEPKKGDNGTDTHVEAPKNNGNGTDTNVAAPKSNGNGTDTNVAAPKSNGNGTDTNVAAPKNNGNVTSSENN